MTITSNVVRGDVCSTRAFSRPGRWAAAFRAGTTTDTAGVVIAARLPPSEATNARRGGRSGRGLSPPRA
jgi:hypothetical protein